MSPRATIHGTMHKNFSLSWRIASRMTLLFSLIGINTSSTLGQCPTGASDTQTIGTHTLNFYGHTTDDPAAGQSTWFYCVESGSSPSLSHITFSINLESCLEDVDVLEAGEWGPTQSDRTPWDSNIEIGHDPTTNIVGIKFDRSLEEGETVNLYFSLDDLLAEDESAVAIKAGASESSGTITGPTADCCEEGEIRGFLYLDSNGDGVHDPGETTTLQGDVSLFVGVSSLGVAGTDATTGEYSFTGLDPYGDYDVDAIESSLDPRRIPTNPTGGPVNVPPPVCATQNFLFSTANPSLGALGDFVWYDVSKDGNQDPQEPGVYDVLMRIVAPSPAAHVGQESRTDKNGEYFFFDLTPGEYTVTADGTTAYTTNIVGPQPGGPTSGDVALKRGDSRSQIKGNFDQNYLLPPITGTVEADFLNQDFDFRLTLGGLPVELLSFSANVVGRDIILSWETGSELSNSGFSIEQSISDHSYREIGFVVGAGTSQEHRAYSFKAVDVTPGHYSFRLKQIDLDGNFNYSEILDVAVSNPDKFYVSPAYPNPFNPQTTMSFSVMETQHVKVSIHDALGRSVMQVIDQQVEANRPYEIRIDATSWPSGLYLVRFLGESFSTDRLITFLK